MEPIKKVVFTEHELEQARQRKYKKGNRDKFNLEDLQVGEGFIIDCYNATGQYRTHGTMRMKCKRFSDQNDGVQFSCYKGDDFTVVVVRIY